jgi:hypothetical protein
MNCSALNSDVFLIALSLLVIVVGLLLLWIYSSERREARRSTQRSGGRVICDNGALLTDYRHIARRRRAERAYR